MLIWLDGELKTRSQITSNMIGQGQCPIALVYEYVCACSKVISIRCNGRCLSESRLSELANRLLRIRPIMWFREMKSTLSIDPMSAHGITDVGFYKWRWRPPSRMHHECRPQARYFQGSRLTNKLQICVRKQSRILLD